MTKNPKNMRRLAEVAGMIKINESDSEKYLIHAITEDIAEWYKQWNGCGLGFDAKSDIYNVILNRFKKRIEI